MTENSVPPDSTTPVNSSWKIDQIVGELRELRERSLVARRRKDRPARLPSRKAITEIVESLSAALFPNRLGSRELGQAGVDYFVGHTLNVTLSALVEEVLRELQFVASSNIGIDELGYQAESGPWRNFYLSGAQELRDGIRIPEMTTTASSQSMGALPLPAIFDSLAVRLNSGLATGANLAINFQFTDTQENYLLTMKGGVLHHFAGRQHAGADCTVYVTRPAFDEILDGRSTFARQIFRGDASLIGNPRKLIQFFRPVEPFEPWFQVMLPRPNDSNPDVTQQ